LIFIAGNVIITITDVSVNACTVWAIKSVRPNATATLFVAPKCKKSSFRSYGVQP